MSRIFKSQKLMLSLMAFTLLVILMLFGYLRLDVKVLDFPTYQALLESNSITKAIVEENEITLITSSDRYKIIKDGIDVNALLKKVPIEVKTTNPLMQDLILLGVLFCAIVVLLVYARRKRAIELAKEQEQNQKAYAFDPFGNTIIRPVRSKTTFKDVAGIHDVKEEL